MSNNFLFFAGLSGSGGPYSGAPDATSLTANQGMNISTGTPPQQNVELPSTVSDQHSLTAKSKAPTEFPESVANNNYVDPELFDHRSVTYHWLKIVTVRGHLSKIIGLDRFWTKEIIIAVILSDSFGILSLVSSSATFKYYDFAFWFLILILLIFLVLVGIVKSNALTSKTEAQSALDLLKDPNTCIMAS